MPNSGIKVDLKFKYNIMGTCLLLINMPFAVTVCYFIAKFYNFLIDLPETDVIIPVEDQSRRLYLLTGLKPGTANKFRVKAANMYGVGIPSSPSGICLLLYPVIHSFVSKCF